MNHDDLMKLWKECAITAENSGEWKQPITVMAGVIIGVNQELKRLSDLEKEKLTKECLGIDAERKAISQAVRSVLHNDRPKLADRILAGEFAKGEGK